MFLACSKLAYIENYKMSVTMTCIVTYNWDRLSLNYVLWLERQDNKMSMQLMATLVWSNIQSHQSLYTLKYTDKNLYEVAMFLAG